TVWPRVREAAAALGGGPAGMAAYESVRIAQGLPRWGADWREGLLAKEAGLDAAVSYTKGCYPGQEPTYRLHFRGQPAKRLMRLRLAGGATAAALATLPVPPVPLVTVEGKPAGEVTSLARLPDAETDGA